MKFTALILFLAMLTGCATTRKAGGSIANAGKQTGKTGNAILAGSSASIVLIPVGIAFWIPMQTTAAILYYPGQLISGEDAERNPFEL